MTLFYVLNAEGEPLSDPATGARLVFTSRGDAERHAASSRAQRVVPRARNGSPALEDISLDAASAPGGA